MIELDGVVALPCLNLRFGSILRHISSRVAAQAISDRFDQRGSCTRSGPLDDPLGACVDLVDIVAVDDDFLESVGRCAGRSRVLDGCDQINGRVLHVEVVLADKNHWEFPNGSKVERLVERPNVRAAVTEEAHCDLVAAA